MLELPEMKTNRALWDDSIPQTSSRNDIVIRDRGVFRATVQPTLFVCSKRFRAESLANVRALNIADTVTCEVEEEDIEDCGIDVSTEKECRNRGCCNHYMKDLGVYQCYQPVSGSKRFQNDRRTSTSVLLPSCHVTRSIHCLSAADLSRDAIHCVSHGGVFNRFYAARSSSKRS